MTPYKTLLFDLDGTLTDPGEGITNSVAYALRCFGIKPPIREALYPFIGPPLADSFQNFYGFSNEDALKAVECYRVYYREQGIFENALYPGIGELLRDLRQSGYQIILATSKPEQFAIQILEHFGILPYFHHVAGALMDARTKKSEVIAHALAISGAEAASALMIGDREYDVLGAKEFSIPAIGVLYGYGSREELEAAGAASIAESVQALREYLL